MTESALEERVYTALFRNPSLTDGALRCRNRSGHVVLQGVVPTWYQKQLAQETLLNLDGIIEIQNELQVVPEVFYS